MDKKIKVIEEELRKKTLAIIEFIKVGTPLADLRNIKLPSDLEKYLKPQQEYSLKLDEMTEERDELYRKLQAIRAVELTNFIDKYNRGTPAWNILSFSSLSKKQLHELGKLLDKDGFTINIKADQVKIAEELNHQLDVLQQVIASKQKKHSPLNHLEQ